MNMDIEDKIQQLRDQAEKYIDSGEPGKAIENDILAQWLEELLELREVLAQQLEELLELREIYKNTLDVVCNGNLECEQCDAFESNLQRCVLKRKEE